MKQFLTWRVWVLIAAVFIGLIALAPNPWAQGIEIQSVDPASDAVRYGLTTGLKVYAINGQEVTTVTEAATALAMITFPEQSVTVTTTTGEVTYTITNDLGLDVDENLTITASTRTVPIGSTLLAVNGNEITNVSDLETLEDLLIPAKTIKIETDAGTIAYLSRETPPLMFTEVKKTNLRYGLDFTGGTRTLLLPVSDSGTVSDSDIDTLIAVLENRLNVYGLSDIKIRRASDWQGTTFVLVELAGVTEDEVKTLIGQQGKFEARIGNETVFTGGKEDIPYVCRNDAACSGIRSCAPTNDFWACTFDFSITLGQEAAKRQAALTAPLEVIQGEDGDRYLSESLDLYLDGELVDSLLISENLQGQAVTQISITGPGSGATDTAAVDDALAKMNALQTILVTGSLPFDLEIVKLDTISPVMGEAFLQNLLFVALLAIIAITVVLIIRYRKLKLVFPIILTLLAELFLILGLAALIGWNLDMAAIAGILAAIGTGVDDQIVILDESLKRTGVIGNWKERLKRAFFIIFAAYATTVAAMIPLWSAGAGLIRGFALTTIAGVTIGVFITRPAFASILEKLNME